MKKIFDFRFILLTILIFLAVASRLLPHPPNFSPVMAIALFGGAYFADKKFSFVVPIIAMIFSDAIIGFHATLPAVYLSIILGIFIGFSLRKKVTFNRVVLSSLASSVLFYLFTNFAHWLIMGMYDMSFAGLIKCYGMALPFFRMTVAGDLIYCGVLFGVYHLAEKYVLTPNLIKK